MVNTGEDVVKCYHEALSNVLFLFVSEYGYDYSCVDEALDALAENVDVLPTTMALVEQIEQRRKITNESS